MKFAIVVEQRPLFNYDVNWIDIFLETKETDAFIYYVNKFPFWDFKRFLKSDVIILLYSADLSYVGRKEQFIKLLLKFRKGKVVYFPRNEFKFFKRKRHFISECKVDLVCSQLQDPAVKHLYSDLTKAISLPHALNDKLFKKKVDWNKRPIDIGGRSSYYPDYFLDNIRNELTDWLKTVKEFDRKLKIDYSTRMSRRFNLTQWGEFLNNCKFTVSSEAGDICVEKNDLVYEEYKKIITSTGGMERGKAIKTLMRKVKNLASGKTISSRHFDAIGCQTAQILIEGNYDGILKPGKHYIELKRDFSNTKEVLEQMKDSKKVKKMVEAAYDVALTYHTYKHRLQKLFKELSKII